MKQFIAFVRKEFYHILRDKRTLLILIGMPIVQIILFGFAISTEVKNVQTAILVSSTDTDTRYLINRIDANEYFTVKYIVHSPEELEVLFRKTKLNWPLPFPRISTDDVSIQNRFRLLPMQPTPIWLSPAAVMLPESSERHKPHLPMQVKYILLCLYTTDYYTIRK